MRILGLLRLVEEISVWETKQMGHRRREKAATGLESWKVLSRSVYRIRMQKLMQVPMPPSLAKPLPLQGDLRFSFDHRPSMLPMGSNHVLNIHDLRLVFGPFGRFFVDTATLVRACVGACVRVCVCACVYVCATMGNF